MVVVRVKWDYNSYDKSYFCGIFGRKIRIVFFFSFSISFVNIFSILSSNIDRAKKNRLRSRITTTKIVFILLKMRANTRFELLI